jgi:hypothetical protein
MYSGNLIDQLMASVERAEARARQQSESADLERWYAVAAQEVSQPEHDLLGVA